MDKTRFPWIDIHEQDPAHCTTLTALHWAAALGHVEAFKLVMTKCHVTRPCNLRCRLMNGQVVVFKGWTALSLASFFGHVKVVEAIDILELLLSKIHKFNINEEDSAGFSAVQIAACGSQPEIIRYVQFLFSFCRLATGAR